MQRRGARMFRRGSRLRRDRDYLADPVDMAGDDVAAQFVADPGRAFQIDRAPSAQSPSVVARQALARDLHREPVRALLDHGQAAAGVADRGAQLDRRQIVGGLDLETRGRGWYRGWRGCGRYR